MTTLSAGGIAIGGSKKAKKTTIAATLPSDFYRKYQPPKAPRIKPVREGPASLKMAEMSLPEPKVLGGVTAMTSFSLRNDELPISRTMPAARAHISGHRAGAGAEEDSEVTTGVAKMTVGSLTAMDVMKAAPGAGGIALKSYTFSTDSTTAKAMFKKTDTGTQPGTEAPRKKKAEALFAMEESDDDEEEEEDEDEDESSD